MIILIDLAYRDFTFFFEPPTRRNTIYDLETKMSSQKDSRRFGQKKVKWRYAKSIRIIISYR